MCKQACVSHPHRAIPPFLYLDNTFPLFHSLSCPNHRTCLLVCDHPQLSTVYACLQSFHHPPTRHVNQSLYDKCQLSCIAISAALRPSVFSTHWTIHWITNFSTHWTIHWITYFSTYWTIHWITYVPTGCLHSVQTLCRWYGTFLSSNAGRSA